MPYPERMKQVPDLSVTAQPIDVGLGVIRRSDAGHPDRVLVTLRRCDTVLPGLWEIPGGKREGDESIEACVARELYEEVGLKVAVGQGLGVWEHHYPHAHVRLQAFWCSIIEGQARPIAVEQVAWVDAEQLLERDYPEASLALIQRIAEALRI